MKLERRDIHLTEVKASDASGVFSGYGAIFGNEDSYGDVIKAGAFASTISEWNEKGKLPPMLLQHGGGFLGGADDMLPVGEWTSMEENSRGLKLDGRLFALNTERGQYIYEGLKAGVLDGLSIGYRVRKSENGTKPGQPERTLTDIDLWEVSIVTFPANPKARVTAVKSLSADELRDLEDILGERGLSRKDRVIAASVFRNWLQRDAGAPENTPRDEVVPDDVGDTIKALQSLSERMQCASILSALRR